MLGNFIDDVYFSRLAKKKNRLENKGEFSKADAIGIILESNNRCLCCGGEQYYDETYYKRTGIWKCSRCNG